MKGNLQKSLQSSKDMFLQEAERFREAAKYAAPGKERDLLLRRARQAEVAARAEDWIASPGLRSPE